ncbi:Serine/threonine-protein kinase NIM1-like [Aphelenchoides fujianensis]|nr:Serine/threonine-protein kinase NIM1-like [Aphelenchoides fujianensis]
MLIDFGFSMQVADNELSTNFCGSLPYSSPELLYEKPHHAKPVDMWALGVLLFYMLTGTLPFSGLTPDEMRSNIFRSSYSLPAGIHDKFVKLLAGLLEPNPDLRFTIEKVASKKMKRVTKGLLRRAIG